jgi:hypothetical protein
MLAFAAVQLARVVSSRTTLLLQPLTLSTVRTVHSILLLHEQHSLLTAVTAATAIAVTTACEQIWRT